MQSTCLTSPARKEAWLHNRIALVSCSPRFSVFKMSACDWIDSRRGTVSVACSETEVQFCQCTRYNEDSLKVW